MPNGNFLKDLKKKDEVSTVSTAIVIKSIEKDAAFHERQLKKITTITSQDDMTVVALNLKNLKAYAKIATDKMKGIIDPIKLSIKRTEELFEPFITKVEELEKTYKAMMLEYENKKSEKADNLTKQLQSGKIKNLSTYTRKMEELNSGKSEHSSTRTSMVPVVVDVKKIPRQYLVPDMKAIKAAIKDGKVIPGIELQEKKTIAI